jgi:hypothetical protein
MFASYAGLFSIIFTDLETAFTILFFTGIISILGIKYIKDRILKLIYFLKIIYEDIIFEDSSCTVREEN